MFLSKSTSGVYHLFCNDESGKRRKITSHCRLKADAIEFLKSFKAESKTKFLLLSDFIFQFLAYAEGNFSKGIIAIYKSKLDSFLTLIGNIPLSSDSFIVIFSP